MPIAELDNVHLHYRVDGPDDAPWLLLCNALGTTLEMWDAQIPALAERFRVLRYDRRGHGRSSVPPGPYATADLGGDVLGLMDALGIARGAFCGLSIGGLTGQWLALHAPERFTHIALCCTATRFGDAQSWDERMEQIRTAGMGAIADAAVARWFTPDFAAQRPEIMATLHAQVAQTPPDGYIGCIGALRESDFGEDLRRADITVPLLTVAGRDDPGAPPSALRAIADCVPGACSVELPGAHLCNIESAERFNEEIARFLAE